MNKLTLMEKNITTDIYKYFEKNLLHWNFSSLNYCRVVSGQFFMDRD